MTYYNDYIKIQMVIMKNNDIEISASEFKKHSLRLFNEVKDKHSSFIITKRKIPIAKVTPLDETSKDIASYFGFLKCTLKINGDIISYSTENEWEANGE